MSASTPNGHERRPETRHPTARSHEASSSQVHRPRHREFAVAAAFAKLGVVLAGPPHPDAVWELALVAAALVAGLVVGVLTRRLHTRQGPAESE